MELVVAETGVDSHFVYPDGKDIFNLTDKLIWYMDEPYQSQSAFLGYHVFQKAKENNVKVLLNGQGADEYFNCYGGLLSFLPLELVKKLRIGDTWSLLRKMNASQRQSFYRQLLEILMPFSFWSIAKRIKKLDPKTNEVRNVLQRKKFSCGFRHPYLIDDFRKTSGRTVSRHQLCIEPLPKYLRWEDRNSMAHSVEARVPFLCHHLVEFTQSLPIQYLTSVEQPKRIMAESLRGCLTEAIRNRQDKQGFITPEQRWFIKDHRDEFLSLLETNIPYAQGLIDRKSAIDYLRNMQLGKIEFDYSYWRIILFCIWMKVFSVKV
jgi:asparagine synthase (glutamine-hydrolysing)